MEEYGIIELRAADSKQWTGNRELIWSGLDCMQILVQF